MFKVTNNNPTDFIGRHNGADYVFLCDSPVYIDDAAATHIFGLGVADKSSILARHGWAGPTKSYTDGMKILNRFSFESVQQTFDAPLARDIPDMIAAAHAEQAAAEQAAAANDHGPAPVIQDTPVVVGGTDDAPDTSGAVADTAKGKRKRPPGFGDATDPAA